VAAGFGTTCAITAGGTVYCWGANYYGKAGADTAVNPVYIPAPIAGGLTYRELGGGYFHTCGIETGGLARCWGYGVEGELGNGTSGPQAITSSPVAVSGGVTFTSLAAGAYFSCALATNGAILCWGSGYDVLGNGTVTASTTPVAVASAVPFQSVAAAEERACGVSQAGDVYCWGWNYYGLGDGVNSVSFLPVRVPLP